MTTKTETLVDGNRNSKTLSHPAFFQRFEKAQEAFSRGLLTTSEKILQQLEEDISDDTNCLGMHLRITGLKLRIVLEQGNYSDAQNLMERARALEESVGSREQEEGLRADLAFLDVQRAVCEFSHGVYVRALHYARAAEWRAPAEDALLKDKARYIQATVLAYTGELQEAENLIEEIQNPDLKGFLDILRGDIKRFAGDPSGAVAAYEQALDAEKNNKNGKLYHTILLNLAKSMKSLEEFGKANLYLTLTENSVSSESFTRFNQFTLLERIDLLLDMDLDEEAQRRFERIEVKCEDVYFRVQYLLLKAKILLSRDAFEDCERTILELKELLRVTDNSLFFHFIELKEAELALKRGDWERAYKLASENLRYFERKCMHQRIVTCLWIMSEVHLANKRYAEANQILRRKVALEVRFAYYRNYVQSSILLAVTMKRSGETQGYESILLNALKVAHRVNLPAERAAIYKLLGEEQNYLRELSSLDDEGKAQIERFMERFDVAELFDYDLIIDQNTHTVVHRQLGTISFGNKFSLIKILVTLAEAGARSVSKEHLAECLWKRPYNPLIDDNTIYIHVNRLRKVLEMEPSRPTVVINTPDGYQLNPQLRIRLVPANNVALQDRFARLRELLSKSGGSVTSRQVREVLNVSKATAARELSRWIQEGRIARLESDGQFLYTLGQGQS